MRSFMDRLKYNGLFIKMFSVMLVSIVSVALLTWFVMLQMTEKLFIDTFSITNSKIVSQIQTSFESLNYAVSMAASNVTNNGTIKGFLTTGEQNAVSSLRSYYEVSQQMKRIQSNVAAYPVTITITGMNGKVHSTDSSYWPQSFENLKDNALTIRTLNEPRRLLYQLDTQTLIGSSNEEPIIVASKALLERTTGTLYGVLYFAIKESEFKQVYSGFTSAGNDVIILDRFGTVVSSNKTELIGSVSEELLQQATDLVKNEIGYKETKVMDKNSLVLAEYLPTYDFYVVNVIDKEIVISQMMDFKTVALICAAIVIAALIIVFVISRRLTRSLTLLARQMSRITKRNFGNYITVSGSHEIKELGNAYNYMLDELNDYIKRLIETQKEQRNAELSALQMQINPHFLYNTLASVKILVQQGNKEKAAATINALISLLQNTVGNISETITVEQELVNLKNYVFINHVRYGERIHVNYFVSDDCSHYHLPKLIIQPFIENAFFHAFRDRDEGYIYLLISREGESLICEVVDNGIGMKGFEGIEKLKSTRQQSRHFFSGIGIRNVNDRIELLYGEQYGVSIVSNEGEGTRVRIKLPIITP